MKYCCQVLEIHLTNNCDQHGLDCPDNVIRKYKRSFGIPHVDGSYYAIKYCPWCGKKLKHEKD